MAFSRSLPNYNSQIREGENAYLETDHDVNVTHLGSVLGELHCKDVGYKCI